jgi:hypothetical protein
MTGKGGPTPTADSRWRRVRRAPADVPGARIPLTSGETMQCLLIAYPLRHRHAFVRRLAAQVLARTPALGEKHIAHQLRRQAIALTRKGFGEDVVRREVGSLEAAVRREIWLTVLGVPSAPSPPPASEQNGQLDTSA